MTAHNLLIVAMRDSSSVTINVPTDTASDTFTCNAQFTGGTSTTAVRICWANNIVGGSTTVTCPASANANLWCVVAQYSGNPTGCQATLADGSQATGSTNSGATVTSGSYTATASDLLVAVSAWGANTTVSAGAILGTTATLRSASATVRIGEEDRLNVSGTGTAAMGSTVTTDADIVFQGFLPSCPAAGGCSPTLTLMGVGRCG